MAHLAILGTRGIPANYGGFETFAERLAHGLVARGHEVTVFCQGKTPSTRTMPDGVRLVTLSAGDGPLGQVIFDVRCSFRVRKGYDVVYMLGYVSGPFVGIPRLFGVPVWLNPDGLEWTRSKWSSFGGVGRWLFRLAEKLAVAAASLVVADSQEIAAYHRRTRLRSTPVTFVPYGADVLDQAVTTDPLNLYGIEANRYYLVVCRIVPENHVLEIVRGFNDSDSQFPLIIVGDTDGDTPYHRRVQAEAEDSDRVRLAGTVFDQEALAALRVNAFAYLHGHSVGGTNPSLLEAMGAGNPVLAHDNRFNREVAGDCAVYFSTSGDIPREIEGLEGCVGKRDALAQRAVERVEAAYQWESVIGAYHELLLDGESE